MTSSCWFSCFSIPFHVAFSYRPVLPVAFIQSELGFEVGDCQTAGKEEKEEEAKKTPEEECLDFLQTKAHVCAFTDETRTKVDCRQMQFVWRKSGLFRGTFLICSFVAWAFCLPCSLPFGYLRPNMVTVSIISINVYIFILDSICWSVTFLFVWKNLQFKVFDLLYAFLKGACYYWLKMVTQNFRIYFRGLCWGKISIFVVI